MPAFFLKICAAKTEFFVRQRAHSVREKPLIYKNLRFAMRSLRKRHTDLMKANRSF